MIDSPRLSRRARAQYVLLTLVAILIVGFGLRLFGLDWDEATYLHPDERHVVADVLVGRITLEWPPDLQSLFDPSKSTINPRPLNTESGTREGFAYGTFPLYVTDLVAEGATHLTGVDWHSYGRVHYLGRVLSLLLDTGTILLTFLLGRQVAGDGAGLFAALWYALAPIAIQLAHFFTSESWITFFVTLSLLGAVHGAQRGTLPSFVLAGGAAGLALASKSSVGGIVIPIAVAAAWDAWRRLSRGDATIAAVNAMLARGTIACCACLICFVLGEPFALLDAPAYLESLRLQIQIQSGAFDVPFTRQYVGTPRGWYQLEQLLRWGLGPIIGLLSVVGAVVLVAACLRRRRHRGSLLVVLSWLAVYGLAILLPESKFLRYLLPLIPVLTIGAGVVCVSFAMWAKRRGGHQLMLVALAVSVLAAAGWSAAFASLYARPHPRLAASAWLFEHGAAGSATSNEVWDDRLPISAMPGLDGFSRRIDGVQVNLYHDFPTYGDAQVLAEAFAATETSSELAAALRQHDYAAASRLLQGPLVGQLLGMQGSARVALSGDLSHAASRMTTSRALRAATVFAAQALLQPDDRSATAWFELAAALGSLPTTTAEGYLYDVLSRTDYYIISSNRIMTGIDRAPWRYPVQNRFYDLLFSGHLGFHLETEFTSYPGLGGITFADDTADESFINYDHPHVWIFKKDRLPDRQSFARLMAAASLQQTVPERAPPDDDALVFDRQVGELPVVDDARWSASLTDNSWWALVVWMLLLVGLQAAGAPLASVALGGFPDRGWAAARLLALLLAAWIVWLLASVQAIAFRAVWCFVALGVVALSAWMLRRWFSRHQTTTIDRRSGRVFVVSEVVFWVTFSLFLLFRYLNPDSWHPLWGGEKPMEFAHLNAVLRSAHFPPVDPWYSGGYINYYYYGTYLVAFAIKLTGIPSEIAFNLAQPTVIALFAALTFSVTAAIGSRLSGRPRLAVLAGLVGVLFVNFSGNMLAATRVLQTLRGDVGRIYRWDYWVWDARQVIPFTINEFPYFTALYADLHAHVIAWPITVLVIALAYAVARDRRSLVLASTAPNRFRGPATLLIVRLILLGLVIGSLAPTNAWDVATYAALFGVAVVGATAGARSLLKRAGVVAACLGLVAVIGSMAYLPFHLHYVALFRSIGRVEAIDTTPLDALLVHFGGPLTILLFGLVLLAVGQAGRSRVRWLRPPQAMALVLAAFLFVRYSTTRAPELEDLAGAVAVAVIGLVLLVVLSSTLPRRADFGLTRPVIMFLLVGAGVAVVLALQSGRTSMAVYLAFGCAAALGWLVWEKPTERFVAALIAAGMLVGATLEVAFLADNLSNLAFFRMNTVFKFYNQLWVLFAIAAGALVAPMVQHTLPSPSASSTFRETKAIEGSTTVRAVPAPPKDSTNGWSAVALIVTIAAMVLSIAYPLTATLPRLETRFTDELGSETLNALDWMEYGTIATTDGDTINFADDRAVIDWFNTYVAGTPVIAEAAFGPYRCNGSRISIATGLPAVVGWVNHQTQQRDGDDLLIRERDLHTLYTDPNIAEKREIIAKYGIEYIVVGELERHYPRIDGSRCEPDGSVAGIQSFEEMVGSTLQVVFRSGNTLVYRVV